LAFLASGGLAAWMSFCTAVVAVPAGIGVGALQWSDEFNGSSLNLSNWAYRPWPTEADSNFTPNAVSVTNGVLTMQVYTENGTNYDGYIQSAQQNTSGVFTKTLFDTTYGYIEARMLFQTAPGEWNAFWMISETVGNPVGQPQTAGTEIDIVEHNKGSLSSGDVSSYYNTAIHWDGYGAYAKSESHLNGPVAGLGNGSWHKYGLLWTPASYQFYFDDVLEWTASPSTPVSQHSEFLLLSSEIQNGSWAGYIPPGGYGAKDSMQTYFQVDYVRVYAIGAPVVPAATDTWTGNMDTYWSTPGNWTGGNAPPVAGDSLLFGPSTPTTLTNDLIAGTAFSSLTFQAGAPSFTLNGNSILLSGGTATNTIGIANNSGLAQVIGTMPLTLDRGCHTFSSPLGGSIALNGGVTLNAGAVAYFDPNVTSTAFTPDGAGLISGLGGAGLMFGTTAAPASGPGPIGLATISGGVVTALATFTPYGSGPIASGQNLQLTASGASASLTAANGTTINTISVAQVGNSAGSANTTLQVAASGTMTFNDHGGVYVLKSGAGSKSCFTLSSGTGGFITAGTGTAPASIVVAVNGDNAGNQATISSVIKDNGANGPVSVIVSGSGAVVINGVNTYSGGLYINQGQFQGNTGSVGTGPIYVASGATAYLNGAGTYANNIYISPGYGTAVETTTNANPGAILLSGSGAAGFTGTLTLLGAPVPATSVGTVAGDRLTGGNVAGNTYTFAGQITGTGTLDLNADIRSCTMVLTNDSTASPNNWQGGLMIEESLSAPTSARNIVVKLGADNQIPSGASAGDVALFSADATAYNSLVRLDLNGHNNTINGLYAPAPANASPVQVANNGTANSTLTLGANNASGTFYGTTADNGAGKSLSLVKIGAGRQTFYTALAHNGNTTISNGIFALSGSATMVNSPAVSVASGATFDASGIGGFTVGTGKTLAGLGTVVGSTVVNGTVNPSMGAVGTLTNSGLLTFAGGGSYVWDINNATGTAGTDSGWGLLNITGNGNKLAITANSGAPFNLKITSLAAGDVPGAAANFDPNSSYSWTIAQSASPITGFDASAFRLDATAFSSPLANGSFSLGLSADQLRLVLSFTPAGPTLTVTHSLPNLTFSWPTNRPGYVLESTPSLVPPSWTTNLPPYPLDSTGTNYAVSVTAGAGTRFFRLISNR
jgi:autotransporter-associated beta strand protein